VNIINREADIVITSPAAFSNYLNHLCGAIHVPRSLDIRLDGHVALVNAALLSYRVRRVQVTLQD